VQTLKEGLKHSRGKYFAYLGSDDIWLPEFLAARIKLLQSRINAVLAYGHCFVIDEEDQILECTKDWAAYADGCVRDMLLNVTVPFSPSVVYRRDILERHHWNEVAALEDYDLYIRLSSEGEFAFDDNILCAWRSHGKNNSRDLEFMLRECLEAQRRAVPVLKLTPKELEKANASLKWRFNLRGAPSYSSIVRMIGNAILPTRVLRWRRHYTQRRATNVYGSLKAG
jgi:glycosyltransferase involved in cell wall biosynthesis